MSILIANQITRNFGSFRALDMVSFEISAGEIVGFLGKNGAGKTTMMRILTSYLSASSGSVLFNGIDVAKNSLMFRQNIGYLPEKPPLYSDMTVQNYLKFAAEIKDVTANRLKLQLSKVLEDCDLQHVKNKTISTLSKGYQQRVGIAQAIIHEPKLLILDEPTSGLDPIQINQVLALIKSQKDQRTVLLSTHTLNEIEQVAQRVLMIKSGQIILDGSLDEILKNNQQNGKQPLTLEQVFILHHSYQTTKSTPLEQADQ